MSINAGLHSECNNSNSALRILLEPIALCNLLEKLDPLIQRLVKRFFLTQQCVFDQGLFDAQLGENVAHGLREDIDQAIEERLVKSERASVTHGAAQDAAQDVTASFVARLDSIRDREAQRADVIGDDTEGDVDLRSG